MENHSRDHFYYSLFACGAEYCMSFSFHFLPTIHLHTLATWMGVTTFAIYSFVSAVHFKHSVAQIPKKEV